VIGTVSAVVKSMPKVSRALAKMASESGELAPPI
jgi:hypothetical protein